MKKTLLVTAISLALLGCNESKTVETESAATVEAEKVEAKNVVLESGILVEGMDTSVKPGDDFNQYVNGNWLKNTEIPADKSSYGIFTRLREESQANVKSIIEASANGNFAKGTDEQKVGDLYHSFMDAEQREKVGLAPLYKQFTKIDAIGSYDDLAVYLARANMLGYGGPFTVAQYADFKDPNTYMIYAWQGGIGLPDREYYFTESEASQKIRDSYKQHIAKSLSLVGISNADDAAQRIYDLESAFASHHMKKEQTRNMVALYNKIPVGELKDLMPKFNWQLFLAEAKLSELDGLVVTQLDYMKALDNIISETSLDDWKTYLKWAATNATSARLTKALDEQRFDFYSKTLSGVKEQQPMWRRGVDVVNGQLGEVVGKVYVKKHFPVEAKSRMNELVNNLLKAYEISIKELDWMTEETKKEALDKLSKFTPKIGYPDKWRDYSLLTIEADDLYGNMERSAMVAYKQMIEKQKGPVQKHEWGMTPQTVNAYYNPPLNEIVFPAAILQPPFFNLAADDAVNYGAIGAVIGHEIGHGFDDSGATFDGDGVLRNWWTDKDKEEFKKRTGALVAQYNEFKPFDDLSVNGEFTLGENIGDLGGISIGLLAYKLSLEGKEAPVMDGFTGEQRVFLGYAQVWRNKYRDEALRQLINTDPHSPSMYRVNGAVRNVPEFYQTFNVKEGDKMYLPEQERVKIW